jgi:septin 3/9/12
MAAAAAPSQQQASSIFPKSHVGFDSITQQIERKLLKRGFQFNVICVGQTGLGKSTLINTIFASHLIESKGRFTPDEQGRSTTEIHPVTHVIEENGVRLRLNIVDTPGYGDLVNNDRCWDPIVKYIKDQHSAYLRKELTAQRDRYIQDTRIHCCLYFIQPTGHALKPIDIVVLKKLSEIVNVVPVIAKADALTLEERQAFKDRIRDEFAFHNIRLYPYDNEEYDHEETAVNQQIKVMLHYPLWTKMQLSNTFARTSFPSPSSVATRHSTSTAAPSAEDKTSGVSSTSKMRTTASSSTSATSSPRPTCKI